MPPIVTTVLEAALLAQMLYVTIILYKRYKRSEEKTDLLLLGASIAANLIYPILLIPFIVEVILTPRLENLYNAGYYFVGLLVYSLLIYSFQRVEKREQILENTVEEQTNELINIKERVNEQQLEYFERMLEAADQMIHVIRHDLTKPFRVIDDGLMQLHLYPDDPANIEEMDKAVSKLGTAINALTGYADYGVTRKTLTDLNELVDNVITSANIPKGIDIIVEKSEEFIAVQVDSSKLSQALNHLVDNAVESINEQGKIWISISTDAELFTLSICDNGEPIPRTDHNRVFTPFYTTKENGMGLGLVYVKDIVESHNGEISFTSNEAQTCFTMVIPKR